MGHKRNLGKQAKLAEQEKKEQARKAARWNPDSVRRVAAIVVLSALAVAVVAAVLGNALV